MQVVVLAGGLATRMLPRTETTPKLLLEVAGAPFVDRLFERLRQSRADEVVLCIGHLGGSIREHVGDGARFGLEVRYSEDGPEPLGTAGCLVRARPLLADRFLVTYGDSYLSFDYGTPLQRLEHEPNAEGALAVFRNEGSLEPSNVAVRDGFVVRYDKTRAAGGPRLTHIDYGAMALTRGVIDALPTGVPLGLDRVQADLAARGVLAATEVTSRFYEIGSPEGLRALEHHLATPVKV